MRSGTGTDLLSNCNAWISEIGACPRSQPDPAVITPEKRESCVNVFLRHNTSNKTIGMPLGILVPGKGTGTISESNHTP